jgi:endo-1,4-beta-xylanase
MFGADNDTDIQGSVALKDVYKDHFMIGTAINRSIATGTGGRRPLDIVLKDIALTKHHFNQITAENDMKWQLIHPREGADGYNFAPADAFVDFGVQNGMYLVGHTLVWHSQTPDWVFAGTNPPPESATRPQGDRPRGGPRGYSGPRASREELLERMRDHIHTVVGRYKGKVKSWDVLNEVIADGSSTNILRDTLWLQIIGPDYIAKAFQFAHEADPEAILRYNDYGLENPVKRKKVLTLIRSLQEQNVPIHAIGSQAHVNVSTTFEAMDQAIAEMATLGLPIHITELDVNTATGGQRATGADIAANSAATEGGLVDQANQKLADAYDGIFRAFLKHEKSVEMVTFWGVNDAVSWRSAGTPLLFDGDNKPKPAFDAVIRVGTEAQAVAQ